MREMVDKEINVDLAINNIINRLKENPLIIHSEADLQALLYNELISQNDQFYETNTVLLGKNQKLKTNLVHCQYGLRDIVVFSKNYVHMINDKGLLFKPNKRGKNNHINVFCDSIIEITHVQHRIK